jgi:hypothetical protein
MTHYGGALGIAENFGSIGLAGLRYVEGTTEQWQVVAKCIEKYRGRLDWSRDDLARESDVSPSVIGALEVVKQTRYRPRSVRRVSDALGLGEDGIERILAGEEPEQVRPPAVRSDVQAEVVHLLGQIAQDVAEIAARLRVGS